MVVQGKGAWKGAKPDNKPTQGRVGGTRSSVDVNDPQQQSNIHTLSDYHNSPGGSNKPIPEYTGRPVSNGISFREMFFPWHKLFSFTTIILIVNLIYFIVTLIYAGVELPPAFSSTNKMGGPTAEVLKRVGAKWTPAIVQGHVWRLFTPIFLHSGILHIAMNSYFLARFGWLTEARFNSWRMLAIYIFAGIGSNAASALIAPKTVSCGASGALFGIMGATLVFVILHWKLLRNAFCEALMIVIILAINLFIGFLQPDSGTDNWAHLFGFVYGVLGSLPVIYLWRDDFDKKKEKFWRIVAAITAVVLWALMIGLIWIRK